MSNDTAVTWQFAGNGGTKILQCHMLGRIEGIPDAVTKELTESAKIISVSEGRLPDNWHHRWTTGDIRNSGTFSIVNGEFFKKDPDGAVQIVKECPFVNDGRFMFAVEGGATVFAELSTC